jgi:hypothetical protein
MIGAVIEGRAGGGRRNCRRTHKPRPFLDGGLSGALIGGAPTFHGGGHRAEGVVGGSQEDVAAPRDRGKAGPGALRRPAFRRAQGAQ